MVFIVHLRWIAAGQPKYMVNTIWCIYRKLPPDDEWLIYSKHVEDDYWNKLKKKVYLIGPYYANIQWCRAHRMSNSSSCAWPHILTWSSARKQFIFAGPTASLRLHHASPSLGGELKWGRYISPSEPTHTTNVADPSSPVYSTHIYLSTKFHLAVVPYTACYPSYKCFWQPKNNEKLLSEKFTGSEKLLFWTFCN